MVTVLWSVPNENDDCNNSVFSILTERTSPDSISLVATNCVWPVVAINESTNLCVVLSCPKYNVTFWGLGNPPSFDQDIVAVWLSESIVIFGLNVTPSYKLIESGFVLPWLLFQLIVAVLPDFVCVGVQITPS